MADHRRPLPPRLLGLHASDREDGRSRPRGHAQDVDGRRRSSLCLCDRQAPHGRRVMTHAATTLAAGKLYALGGAVALDGRASWVPSELTGYQATNAYLLTGDDAHLLVDTGPAYHERALMDQLAGLVPEGSPITVFLTRAESDCYGCLGPVA